MRRGVLIAGLAAVTVLAAGAVWYLFIRSDAPEELTIEGAVQQLQSTTTATEPAPSSTEAASTTSEDPETDTVVEGSWTADLANTVVGYRIGEELSGIGVAEAVGRTSQVDASMSIAGTVAESVEVTVDMTSLQSDSDRRDGALANRGLETAAFPEASFSLTEPVDFGTIPTADDAVSVTAVGDLTLHGVTREVSIPLQASLVGDTIVVVGSLEVALADYDIEKPTGFAVLSIDDVGTLELQLAFTRA